MVLPRPDEYPGSYKGYCHSCGFLAIRTRDSISPLYEADQHSREAGEAFVLPSPTAKAGEAMQFTCGRAAIDFKAEFEQWRRQHGADDGDQRAQWVNFLHRVWPKPCGEWQSWIPGVSPKERREMLDRQWMHDQEQARIEADRKWRVEQAEMEHRWRVEQEEREHRWRLDDKKDERDWHRLELAILGGLVAGASVVSGALNGAISRGWWPW